jgi:hypothetical protein
MSPSERVGSSSDSRHTGIYRPKDQRTFENKQDGAKPLIEEMESQDVCECGKNERALLSESDDSAGCRRDDCQTS